MYVFPILVTMFPEWLSGTEPLPHAPGAVRPSSLCGKHHTADNRKCCRKSYMRIGGEPREHKEQSVLNTLGLRR